MPGGCFWKRWIREHLPTLKRRCKWGEKKRNLNFGDIVVVVDEGLPRNCWLLGRIESALPGSDGLVRMVTVRTNVVLRRPVHKLYLTESSDSEL